MHDGYWSLGPLALSAAWELTLKEYRVRLEAPPPFWGHRLARPFQLCNLIRRRTTPESTRSKVHVYIPYNNMYIYIHTYVHIYIYRYINTYKGTHIRIEVHIYIYGLGSRAATPPQPPCFGDPFLGPLPGLSTTTVTGIELVGATILVTVLVFGG